MSYDLHDRRRAINARRREQVRHLIRSVGVELPDGGRVPFFVEPAPGKFRRNPQLKNVDVRDDQLRTLDVEAEVPARIPSGGLPVAALRYLIEMGLKADDEI
ncbi:MAG TPA: hypothetical protein VFD49_18550 [Candidatus Dormibacteraeota bacterium]|nr:hypothetical protein [Candidatus Dormibacteraeota bacterium]